MTDDPALVILYAQLRQMTLQTLRGASKVTPKAEWEFVLHNARLYDRMGCDLLGLDLGMFFFFCHLSLRGWLVVGCCTDSHILVRNWEFLKPSVSIRPGLGGEIDPIKLVKRRSSLVVADLPVSSSSSVGHLGNQQRHGHGMMMVPAEMKSGGHKQPAAPAAVFEEPDANSLLDSFGF